MKSYKAFDRVILSCNDDPRYVEFWPLVAATWRAVFGVPVWLAFVGSLERSRELDLQKHGAVVNFEPVKGIPVANQAKVARYFLAAMMGNYGDSSPTMTNDIDLLPLSKEHVLSITGNRNEGALLTLGSELYRGPEAGKFTAGFLTAESLVFARLFNPNAYEWPTFIESLVGIKHFDHKEDISSTIDNEHPDCFSDESLLRYLLRKSPTVLDRRPMPFWPYELGALDRANWKFDQAKLDAGVYKEAHLPRPFSANHDKIQPLIDYLSKHYEMAYHPV